MKKKITTSIALGVIALIAVSVIVLYLIPVNYVPKMANPDSIIAYQDASKNQTFTSDNENYDKILNEYNKSLTRNMLSAFFAGQTIGGINTTSSGELPPISNITEKFPKIVLKYNEPQDLFVNGKKQSNQITEIIYQITDNNTYVKANIYFKQSGSTIYYNYQTFASQASIFNFINNLNMA